MCLKSDADFWGTKKRCMYLYVSGVYCCFIWYGFGMYMSVWVCIACIKPPNNFCGAKYIPWLLHTDIYNTNNTYKRWYIHDTGWYIPNTDQYILIQPAFQYIQIYADKYQIHTLIKQVVSCLVLLYLVCTGMYPFVLHAHACIYPDWFVRISTIGPDCSLP